MKKRIKQESQDLPFGNQNTRLGLGFIFRAAGSCGNDHGAVMLGHLLVGSMQERFIAAGFDHGRFRIVGNRDFAYSTEKRVGMSMGGNPGGQLLIQEGFGIGFIAGPQNRHKQKSRSHRPIG